MQRLWKVGLPVDDVLKHTLGGLELNEMASLSPVDEMQEVLSILHGVSNSILSFNGCLLTFLFSPPY
jgi:hypothetical protein